MKLNHMKISIHASVKTTYIFEFSACFGLFLFQYRCQKLFIKIITTILEDAIIHSDSMF